MLIEHKISQYISEHYNVPAEYLWNKFPQYAVFRHSKSRKWFAILMNVAGHKIGLNTIEDTWIINVKAKPELIGSLRLMKGIYPAYHMNKEHWLSLNLVEVDEELLYQLINESYFLTTKKYKSSSN